MKIAAFDIGGTAVKCGVFENGSLLRQWEYPTNARLGGAHILKTVTEQLEAQDGFDAIGISTAGQVNALDGSIIYANSNIPDYTGTQIGTVLGERFRVPVAVENDVNAAAIGEAFYGAGKEEDSFLCLTYGTGIGGAIVMNRLIYHGSSFSAAEFGAIVTHGPEKKAGSDFFDGCYERYASTTALVRAASAVNPAWNTGRIIFTLLDEPAVRRLVDDWIDEILLGLSSLIHIFNPPCVILGGGVMAQPYIIQSLRERIGRYVMPSFLPVRILPAELGNTAGLLGACRIAEQALKKK